MIVNREKMEAALEAHVRRVRDTGHATQVETDLYDALKSAIENGVPDPAPEPTWLERLDAERKMVMDGNPLPRSGQVTLLDRLIEAETMLEEIARLEHDDRYRTWTVDNVLRHDDGSIAGILGTLDTWDKLSAGELIRDDSGVFSRDNQAPYIVGEPA